MRRHSASGRLCGRDSLPSQKPPLLGSSRSPQPGGYNDCPGRIEWSLDIEYQQLCTPPFQKTIPPAIEAHFSFWTPGGAAVPEQHGLALVAPKGLQTQEGFLAGRSPKLPGPLQWTQPLQLESTAPRPSPSSRLRTLILPPLLALPKLPTAKPMFPRAQRPSCSSRTGRLRFNPY